MKVLVTGSLHEAVPIKISKSGNPYAIGKLKEDVVPVNWVSISAFGTLAETLAGMQKGDAFSVSGTLTADIYTPPGKESRANFSITADNIITLKPAKKPKATGSNYQKSSGSKSSGFDVNKFKRDTGYKPQPAPPPPEGSDPF
jgi:single-stranded DNA-binding protein